MTTLNLTRELERLIADICTALPDLSHIDPDRLLVCVSRTRGGGIHGTYAKIHPLRFIGGARTLTRKHGRREITCTMPVVNHCGREILYIIYFLFPRFFDLTEDEKLITVIHELFHISPQFDGDLRRFPGRNFAHGSSTKRYNSHMAQLLAEYRLKSETPHTADFLKVDLACLKERHKAVVGRSFPVPKLIIS
jgi:predicted metallopeptidase